MRPVDAQSSFLCICLFLATLLSTPSTRAEPSEESLSAEASVDSEDPVDPAKSRVYGPGLRPDEVVLPARYFFIQAVDRDGAELRSSPAKSFDVSLSGNSPRGSCHVNLQLLDRHDGVVIVRYRMFTTCRNAVLRVLYRGQHVAQSPYQIEGPIYGEECDCPVESLDKWLEAAGCPSSYPQITQDLQPFPEVDFDRVLESATRRFNHPGSQSYCNYVVKDQQVHRKCYGKYVGFNIFADAILQSLARKMHLPDLELLINLGDWPLVKTAEQLQLPMFSWCGSGETDDILLPTYDLTEASIECMGRVMLDMLSVQSREHVPWTQKQNSSFWRGRDSHRMRLKLVDLSRKRPDLLDAALTHFFFFKAEEEEYGPTQPRVSFFDFFKYKYQVSVDGTVAAYRLPFLLGGGSLLLKQKSPYYEHFYGQLEAGKHYLEVKEDLSDLIEKLEWARAHDAEAGQIASAGQKFAQDNLMPLDVYCYHAVILKEWASRLKTPVRVREDMEQVPVPDHHARFGDCQCHRKRRRDEL